MTPFSRWERELPKLITDGRWSAVGSLKERRLIFDDFCKSCAADHKRGKADGARAARDAFLALLNEAAKGAAPQTLTLPTTRLYQHLQQQRTGGSAKLEGALAVVRCRLVAPHVSAVCRDLSCRINERLERRCCGANLGTSTSALHC